MSTRSVIIRYNANTGNFETAYKHHDGYANTGYLNVFYNTPEKAEAFLNAIMRPDVELRALEPTVKACVIEQNKHYGYTLYPAPAATDRPEKYLPGLIAHGDAEFITLYTPHGWKEFAVESGHFFKASRIRTEEYADYAERMKKSNAELVALWHHVKALATGAPMPSAPSDRRGEPRWGYIYGGKALPIEQRLFPMGSAEYSQVLNTTAKELFNCSDGWSEFFSCTGAQVLYVEKSGEVCFKINPRFMANKANVVKCILWPGNAYATAEFYKTSTKDGKKELTRLDNSASGYPCNHKEKRYRFLDSFRQLTALQTFNPFKKQAEPEIPAWSYAVETGYKPLTNYWQRLYAAVLQGFETFGNTVREILSTASDNYKHFTELVLVLNHLAFAFEKNEEICRCLTRVFLNVSRSAERMLEGDELEYYYIMTN